MCCTRLAENTDRKNYAKNRHVSTIAQLCRATSLQLRYVSTIGKKLVKRQISPAYVLTICWTSAQLTAEIFWRVWGTSANFNGFCILASLLHRRRLTAANQTLHNVWPSPGLVHYIYIFGGSCPLTEFCQLQNSLCVQVFRSPILAALLHGTRAAGVIQRLRRGIQGMELRNVRKGRHLYSEGRPSCWVSAHILAYSSNGILFYLFRLFKVFSIDLLID